VIHRMKTPKSHVTAGDQMKPSKMNHVGLIVRDLEFAEAFLRVDREGRPYDPRRR